MEERIVVPGQTRPTHIAIYHRVYDRPNGMQGHSFQVRFGSSDQFRDHANDFGSYSGLLLPVKRMTRIHVEALPVEFQEHAEVWLKAHFPEEQDEDVDHRILGNLEIHTEGTHAQTYQVYPKGAYANRQTKEFGKKTPGWGAHIEALCVLHLEKLDFHTISTGSDPSPVRARTLVKVGLKAGVVYAIQEWHQKLEAYYQKKLAELRAA